MCLYPKLVQNPKYKKTKKNGGEIPPINDQRVTKVPIGCGLCMECKKQETLKWKTRLLEEIKFDNTAKFITLTFSNENLTKIAYTPIGTPGKIGYKSPAIEKHKGYDLDNEIATRAVRLFLERYRKKYTKSLKHWLITELGHENTENIHLHGIIWTKEPLDKIEKIWQYGTMWKGTPTQLKNGKIHYTNYVNAQTINYIIKYVTKTDQDHKNYRAIVLTSPGIGKNYTNTYNATRNIYKETNTNETYKTDSGHKITLPIYWRNKIYTEEQREKLWLQKLDKQKRYVNGIPIDISKNEQEYFKAQETARKLNKELGYNNPEDLTYEDRIYELQQRQINQNTRMQKHKQKYIKQQKKQQSEEQQPPLRGVQQPESETASGGLPPPRTPRPGGRGEQ